jgi:TatD DNase family protein
MQPKFLDAHTHVQLPAYDADRAAVLARARAASVAMVNIGTQATSSRAAVELAEQNPDDCWATVGYHPSHSNTEWHHDPGEQVSSVPEMFNADVFRELAAHPKVVAIGECGLDYYSSGERRVVSGEDGQKQKEVFISQIEIAFEVKKALMIHCRDAFSDLISILNSQSVIRDLPYPGIIHFFSGTLEQAQQLLDMGFAFTFGGAITFPPRKGKPEGDYDAIIRMLPLENILSETDAPFVAPQSHRGERNEPAYVVEVVKKLAELKNISVDQMAEQIWTNAERILNVSS